MIFLFDACENSGVLEIVQVIMRVIRIITIIAPIILIIMVTLDFAKSVIASKEDEMQKNFSTAIKRIIVCVAIFLIPTIVEFTTGLLDNVGTVGDYTKCITNANDGYISSLKAKEKAELEAEKRQAEKEAKEKEEAAEKEKADTKAAQEASDSKNAAHLKQEEKEAEKEENAKKEKQERIDKKDPHLDYGYVTDIEDKKGNDGITYTKYTFTQKGVTINVFEEGNTKNKVQTVHKSDGSYKILYKNNDGSYTIKSYNSSKKLVATEDNVSNIPNEFYIQELW